MDRGMAIVMDLLVFTPFKDQSGRRLQSLVGNLDWEGTIEIFHSLPQMTSRLFHPSGRETIALLLASTSQDLTHLVNLGSLLDNLRLILVLPDGEAETIAQGHRLHPRFLTYRGGDFSDVALVLQKMQKRGTACLPINPGGGDRVYGTRPFTISQRVVCKI